jgi:hypothetical protein
MSYTLLNITDVGDGGITWIGEHHNKGKKLEEIVGEEKATELKQNLSERASKRVGELNPNFGNRGELSKIYGENNPNFGKKIPLDRIKKQTESRAGYTHSDSTKKKMSESKLGKIRGPHTTEHKANISKSGLGRRYSQPIIQCPICYITGPKGAMTRYHLPNCK